MSGEMASSHSLAALMQQRRSHRPAHHPEHHPEQFGWFAYLFAKFIKPASDDAAMCTIGRCTRRYQWRIALDPLCCNEARCNLLR